MINNIIDDLEELKMLFEYYKSSEINISSIEVGLARAKMQDIYNNIIELDKKNKSGAVSNQNEKKQEIKQEIKNEEKAENNKQYTQTVKPNKVEVPINQTSEKTDLKEEDEINDNEENIEDTQKQPQPKTREELEKQDKSIVADKFQNKKGINEQFSGNEKNKVDSSLKIKPINDIKKAFGINDRFMFIKELFNSNREDFNNELDYLNSLNNYEEAIEQLNSKYNWDNESEAVQSFLSIIRRRFL